MMTKASASALSAWLLKEHPGIFAVILKKQGTRLSGLGDDTPIDPNADLQPVDVTAQYINDPLQNVNVTAQYITPGDLSVANVDTPSLLTNLGSGISSAVSNVASFLLKGTAVVAPVAVAALQAQTATANRNAQMAVLSTQLGRANAGLAPANVTYTANGTPVYIPTASSAYGGLTTLPAGLGQPITLPSGQVGYTLNPTSLANLQPSFLQKYGIWILGGGAALVALLLFS